MKIIETRGTCRERGVMQGTAVRPDYDATLNSFYDSELLRNAKPWFVPIGVVKFGLNSLGSFTTRPAVKKFLPTMYERVEGLAEGLGISSPAIWGMQFVEILMCGAGSNIKIPESAKNSCTMILAKSEATSEKKPLAGRNYDFPNLLRDFQIIRKEKPTDAGRFATITVTQNMLAGAHHGLNESGLMVCSNNLKAWRKNDFNGRGVPYTMVLQEILETCRTTAEAAKFVAEFPARGNTGFFGMLDKSGDCRVVEFSAAETAERTPDSSGVIAQSNHCHILKRVNLPEGSVWTVKGMEGVEYLESTKKRFEAANRLMHENAGKITVDTLKSILRDHSADPKGKGDKNTVCCHDDVGSTLSSIICDVTDGVLYVANSNPCENEYITVKLDG